jgi:tetratricopeptide (TPR) repeat protein
MQRLVDLRPGLPSYSRVAYARELQGDADGAMRALELAAASASNPSDAAFVAFQQGELQWNNGALAEAAAAYARAVRSDASFLPAKAALARLHAASGEPDRAVAEYQAVLAVVPAPQYVIELGDLYASRGRLDLAGEQTDLLRAQEQLFRANGVNVDLEVALFDADHHVDLDNGLTAARAEYGRRQSISAADALAWQLHANGRDAEALPLADDALRLGTGSALFHFHRGVIELGLHEVDGARADLQRALSLNPHFSLLHAPEAARLLESLGTTGT